MNNFESHSSSGLRFDDLPISLAEIRQFLSVPLLCDALDGMGLTRQAPRLPLVPLTIPGLLVGRAKTTLWTDMSHVDPAPYRLELAAVDSCQPEDVLVCAASGSMRSGIWGELLSTAARNRGCAGAILDGAVRDIVQMRSMGFSIFARGTNPYDSRNRQRVIDYDVRVELDGVTVEPGDLVAADADGIVVVPQAAAPQVIEAAWAKLHDENRVRDAIRAGMSASQAFDEFGVL